MKLSPAAPIWLILIFVVLVGGVCLYKLVRARSAKSRNLLGWGLRLISVLLVGLIAIGPSIPGGLSPPGMLNLDVVFAVDTTASMGAVDYNGNRLRIDGVRRDILALEKKMVGARFSLVTFNEKAQIVLPFTTDSSALTSAVKVMNREAYSVSNGSAIDIAIPTLKRELSDSKKQHPNRGRLIFYMGDGEQTINKPVKSFRSLAPLVDGGGVLGYGTKKGAKMLKYSGFTGLKDDDLFINKYIETFDKKSYDFVPAISKIDEPALNRIAEQLGVPYSNRNNGGSIGNTLKISRATSLANTNREVTHYTNLYWLGAIPLVVLLAYDTNRARLKLKLLKNNEEDQ